MKNLTLTLLVILSCLSQWANAATVNLIGPEQFCMQNQSDPPPQGAYEAIHDSNENEACREYVWTVTGGTIIGYWNGWGNLKELSPPADSYFFSTCWPFRDNGKKILVQWDEGVECGRVDVQIKHLGRLEDPEGANTGSDFIRVATVGAVAPDDIIAFPTYPSCEGENSFHVNVCGEPDVILWTINGTDAGTTNGDIPLSVDLNQFGTNILNICVSSIACGDENETDQFCKEITLEGVPDLHIVGDLLVEPRVDYVYQVTTGYDNLLWNAFNGQVISTSGNTATVRFFHEGSANVLAWGDYCGVSNFNQLNIIVMGDGGPQVNTPEPEIMLVDEPEDEAEERTATTMEILDLSFIRPNPVAAAASGFIVSIPKSGKWQLQVYSLNGSLLKSTTIQGNEAHWVDQKLTPGTYQVVAQSEGHMLRQQLIVQ